MQYKKATLTIVIFILTLLTASAQRAEVGITAGGAGYLGDLNQYNPLKFSGITAGAFAKLNFTPFVGLGMHYNFGNIKGNDLKSSSQSFVDRALNFDSKLHELSLIADINFLDFSSPVSRVRLSPYVFAGIGGVYFNTKATYDGTSYVLGGNNLTNADINGNEILYRPYTIVIPYGAGVKYRLSDFITLSSQLGYRTTFTDYLDDVGGYYVDTSVIPLGPPTNKPPFNPSSNPLIGVKGTQRGDLRKRDTYMFVSIGISYNFVSQKCFTF